MSNRRAIQRLRLGFGLSPGLSLLVAEFIDEMGGALRLYSAKDICRCVPDSKLLCLRCDAQHMLDELGTSDELTETDLVVGDSDG